MRNDVLVNTRKLFLFPRFQNIQNGIENCPTVRPSFEQFSDFAAYMESIEQKYKPYFGMVKIVPPQGWKPTSKPYQQLEKGFKIKSPIEQMARGSCGVYQFEHEPKSEKKLSSFKKENEENPPWQHPEQMEKRFWKSVACSAPIYGADILQTLMDESAGSWHLDHLDTILNKGLPKKIRGVNNSYCYYGSWRSLFCWHKEDLDLSAINFLHEGQPKFWYCIQYDDGAILQSEAKKYFRENFTKCQQYLRHKTLLIDPYLLKKNNPRLKIAKMMQQPGEFIVAFGGAYHCGFNFGFNVAQAVNFATMSWVYNLNAKVCHCRKSAVRADPQAILSKLQSHPEVKNDPRFIEAKEKVENQLRATGMFKSEESVAEMLEEMKEQEEMQRVMCDQSKSKKTQPKHKNIRKNSKKQPRNCRKPTARKQSQTETTVYFQCDRCGQWNILPKDLQEQLQRIQENEFCCENVGKQCRNFNLMEEEKSLHIGQCISLEQ